LPHGSRPTVTAEVLTLALAHFAQAIGAGKSKQVPLALDDLEVAQVQRCAVLQNQPDVIRSSFYDFPLFSTLSLPRFGKAASSGEQVVEGVWLDAGLESPMQPERKRQD
jgi:hypothetical protein